MTITTIRTVEQLRRDYREIRSDAIRLSRLASSITQEVSVDDFNYEVLRLLDDADTAAPQEYVDAARELRSYYRQRAKEETTLAAFIRAQEGLCGDKMERSLAGMDAARSARNRWR
tara:strand:+ start:1181 stop:1528 length:348 start_codon:yes stop_codon:yes gene_type:complete